MADFKVQRGQVTIADTASTATITAGVDYTAPAALTAAFIRIVGTHHHGTAGTSANINQNDNSCWINNPGNLLTSIQFNRYDVTSAVTIDYEIIEYIGSGGGANEFIVRGQGIDTLTTAEDSSTTGTISGVVTDADVVAWITGQGGDRGGTSGREAMHTAAWNGPTSDDITFTRQRSNAVASTVSYALIEFTGSNWTVQRASHTTTTPGNAETETITDVGSLTRAFIHPQWQQGSENSSEGVRIWLSATTTVTFQQDANGSATTAVAWVISNSQTDGTPLKVTRYTGTDSGSEDFGHTVTAVAALAESSIEEFTATTPQNTVSYALEALVARYTTTTNVQLRRCRHASVTITYRFATVEWPTVAAGGAGTLTPVAIPEVVLDVEPVTTKFSITPEEVLLDTVAATLRETSMTNWTIPEIQLEVVGALLSQPGGNPAKIARIAEIMRQTSIA